MDMILLLLSTVSKNPHKRRLYTLRGKIIKSLSEIFRADDPVFIAMGRDEITPQIITHAVEGSFMISSFQIYNL